MYMPCYVRNDKKGLVSACGKTGNSLKWQITWVGLSVMLLGTPRYVSDKNILMSMKIHCPARIWSQRWWISQLSLCKAGSTEWAAIFIYLFLFSVRTCAAVLVRAFSVMFILHIKKYSEEYYVVSLTPLQFYLRFTCLGLVISCN
jgi:hypothetical protein